MDQQTLTRPRAGQPEARPPRTGGGVDPCDMTDSLRALARLSTGRMTLPSVLTQIATLAARVVPGAEGAGLLLHENLSRSTVSTAAWVTPLDEAQCRLGEGPGIAAATTGSTVVSSSLADDPRWPAFGRQVAPLGVSSALCLPLLAEDTVLGAVHLYARDENAFGHSAAECGELFAVAAAISVQNTRLLARTQRLAAELDEALATRSVVDRAVGILMSSERIGENAGLGALRELARAQGLELAVCAQFVVNEAALRARASSRR